MTYDADPLLASARRGILFSLKLSIMHKNGPAVYTKCSHELFRAARYNYTTISYIFRYVSLSTWRAIIFSFSLLRFPIGGA